VLAAAIIITIIKIAMGPGKDLLFDMV